MRSRPRLQRTGDCPGAARMCARHGPSPRSLVVFGRCAGVAARRSRARAASGSISPRRGCGIGALAGRGGVSSGPLADRCAPALLRQARRRLPRSRASRWTAFPSFAGALAHRRIGFGPGLQTCDTAVPERRRSRRGALAAHESATLGAGLVRRIGAFAAASGYPRDGAIGAGFAAVAGSAGRDFPAPPGEHATLRGGRCRRLRCAWNVRGVRLRGPNRALVSPSTLGGAGLETQAACARSRPSAGCGRARASRAAPAGGGRELRLAGCAGARVIADAPRCAPPEALSRGRVGLGVVFPVVLFPATPHRSGAKRPWASRRAGRSAASPCLAPRARRSLRPPGLDRVLAALAAGSRSRARAALGRSSWSCANRHARVRLSRARPSWSGARGLVARGDGMVDRSWTCGARARRSRCSRMRAARSGGLLTRTNVDHCWATALRDARSSRNGARPAEGEGPAAQLLAARCVERASPGLAGSRASARGLDFSEVEGRSRTTDRRRRALESRTQVRLLAVGPAHTPATCSCSAEETLSSPAT